MSEKSHSTKADHEVRYTHSGDPRAAGVPTTGVPVNPTGEGTPEVLRHPNSGHYLPRSKGKS